MTNPTSEQADGAGADPGTAAAAPAEQPRVLLQMPVDVRSVSLVVLATLASVFMLRWASAVFIPVMVGVLFSYALSPVVDWLQLRRVPRALSAALLILGLLSGMGATVYSLSEDASKLVELLPVAAQKLRASVRASPGKPDNALVTVQKAATQLEQAAEETSRTAPVGGGVQRVQIEKPKFDIKDHLWNGSMGLLGMLGQIGMVALITFFLMASGDRFRRKLVKLAGPTLSKKRVTLEALNQIHDQIQRYMLVQLFTSVLVGVATWLCFQAIGLEHAAVWGVAAGVLDLVPYVGSVVITSGSALVGFLQFGTLETALLVGGVSLVIHFIEGFLLTPWLTSRANKMNPVAIFVGVLAWGWLWGVWGLLLGVPILVVIKAVCDRVDDLKPVGEFLGA
ncbi:AI-2E family transporter [Rhodoferax sp. UBA5149]|uniref:AI-2E family transporter n=1 Tax=Rhodoferax sp. UBA5149 TaxID=1947379 RepID=UPI0025D89FAE|nr:AI-2E family transporter [Rhodoferax sp. UBA5149]